MDTPLVKISYIGIIFQPENFRLDEHRVNTLWNQLPVVGRSDWIADSSPVLVLHFCLDDELYKVIYLRFVLTWACFPSDYAFVIPGQAVHESGMAASQTTLTVQIAEGIATITLNRPATLNAITAAGSFWCILTRLFRLAQLWHLQLPRLWCTS